LLRVNVLPRRTARWSRAAALLALIAFLVLPAPAWAQQPAEAGLARDAATKAPLECLHVALVDSADHALAHAVTDSAGMFVLVTPGPGAYRVRFELFGWERLVGPLDTLANGEMKEREYPLAFDQALVNDGLAPAKWLEALRKRDDGAWRSASALTPDAPLRYPRSMIAAAASGSVLAQYVVGERGTVRSASWRPLAFTHPEFLAAMRAAVPTLRYQPARIDGHPVCSLVRNHVSFDWGFPVPGITMFN
jgi:hypothetical protein